MARKVKIVASVVEEYTVRADGKFKIVKSPAQGDKGMVLTDGEKFYIPVIEWMEYDGAGGWQGSDYSPILDDDSGEVDRTFESDSKVFMRQSGQRGR